MTDDSYTAILAVVDRSGRTSAAHRERLASLQRWLREQSTAPGLVTVDVVAFDHAVEWQQSFADPADIELDVEPSETIAFSDGTVLFDAFGGAVEFFARLLGELPAHAQPAAVIVVLVAEGLDDASREWTPEAARTRVAHQRDRCGWEFVFLGADQDAVLDGPRQEFDAA